MRGLGSKRPQALLEIGLTGSMRRAVEETAEKT
jgi:hypothetical protein